VPSEPDLWRCETCGQTFVGRNMPHSCLVVDLDSHFEAAPALRPVFDAYLSAAELNGPVTVNATRSRITFQVRMRFAAVERPRRTQLNVHFVLARRLEHSRLRVELVPPRHYVHRLVLRTPSDIDAEVRSWLAEAYAVGEQRHLPG